MTDLTIVDHYIAFAPAFPPRADIAWHRVYRGNAAPSDRATVADALYTRGQKPHPDVDAAWIRIVAADRARTGEIDPTTETSAVLCYLAETPTVTAAALVREGICESINQAYGAIGAEVKKGRVVKVGDGVYGLAS